MGYKVYVTLSVSLYNKETPLRKCVVALAWSNTIIFMKFFYHILGEQIPICKNCFCILKNNRAKGMSMAKKEIIIYLAHLRYCLTWHTALYCEMSIEQIAA